MLTAQLSPTLSTFSLALQVLVWTKSPPVLICVMFSVAVPVEIQLGKSKPVTRLVRTSNEPAVFTMALRQAPARVLLDPGNRVLAVKK